MSKNKFQTLELHRTYKGVTFSTNSDGSILLNGTATETASLTIGYYTFSADMSMTVTGAESGKTWIYIFNSTTGSTIATDTGNGADIEQDVSARLSLRIIQDIHYDGYVVYPMIHDTRDTDTTWVPYGTLMGITSIGKKAQNLGASPQFDGYSGVRIYVTTNEQGEQIIYSSGNDGGRVLEIKNEFGTQQMADNILASIRGYQYQPISAEGALLDPAAELGDGININGVYSGLYSRLTTFGSLMRSDVSAPTDEEVAHEYSVSSANSDRAFTRLVGSMRAGIYINSREIAAEVESRTAMGDELRASITVNARKIEAEVINREAMGAELRSNISMTATEIKSTVARSQQYYYQRQIDCFGYGAPDENGFAPADYRYKYYLDLLSGKVYQSSGSYWIQTETFGTVQSAITQNADKISSEITRAINKETELSSSITQTATSIRSEVTAQVRSERDRAEDAEARLSSSITQTASSIRSEITEETRRAQNEESRLSSSISQTASSISADVSALEYSKLDSEYYSSRFSWELTSSGFSISSNGSEVFHCDRYGIEITGQITATSGYIGNEYYGFHIGSSSIWNGSGSYGNKDSYNADNVDGVYIGTDGIALGAGGFKVDKYGNLYANNATLTGTIHATSAIFDGNVTAGSIVYGGSYGTFSGDGITTGTISGGYMDRWGDYEEGQIYGGSIIDMDTAFSGTLGQVDVNTSDIATLGNAYVDLYSEVASISAGYFNSISTSSIAFQDYYFYVDSDNFVRASPIY